MSAHDWHDQANCIDMPDAIFFPGHGKPNMIAQAVCSTCPVRIKCLAYAMEVESGGRRHGIWGGLKPEQRADLARRRA